MKTTIKLSSLIPHAVIMGTIISFFTGIMFISSFATLLYSKNTEELTTNLIISIIMLSITLACLIPVTSHYKIIIDTDKQTIHYCSSVFGVFNDRKPESYTQFDELKIFQKNRKKGVTSRVQGTYVYTDVDTDILLYNASKSKKLHIKNIGDGKKGISIATQISQLTNLPFIQHEPKS